MRCLCIAVTLLAMPSALRADGSLGQFVLPQAQPDARQMLRDRLQQRAPTQPYIQPGYTFDLDGLRYDDGRLYRVEPPGVEPPDHGGDGVAGLPDSFGTMTDTTPYSVEPSGVEGDGKAQIFLSKEDCGTVALQSFGIDDTTSFGKLVDRMVETCRRAFNASS